MRSATFCLSQTVACLLLGLASEILAAAQTVTIDSPLSPPAWALLERELIRANTEACEEFFARYFDERGFLECVPRWGGNDGPDDAIENLMDWTILYSLGAPDAILDMYRAAWEGHLRQYTQARTVEVEFARDGMYYREFPVKMDWFHNGEGMCVFHVEGLADPDHERFRKRVRRYAGFYMNEDPGAPNYDPEHRIIRSMFSGSRGPLMRRATALDWAGDPIEVENRFEAIHGERNYEEMLGHFREYTDVMGDHPLNLVATSLALNAYMLSHEEKYERWLLEYVDAWKERMAENGDIIPSKIGLDGKIGGPTDGVTKTQWYDGTYGWSFTVVVPQTGELAHRNHHYRGFIGFMNAVLLTGDQSYVDIWRRQRETINAQARSIDGKMLYPQMYGKQGWYHFTPEKYQHNALQIWYLSMQPADLELLSDHPWISYLDGSKPEYPEDAMRRDLERIRTRVAGMRQDMTTPDTRLADDPMRYTPASLDSLMELMLGGLPPGNAGAVLHSRVRYFDPERRRAGIPDQVASLVDRLTADEVSLTLVNLSQTESRTVVIQAGAYAEHQFITASIDGRIIPVDASDLSVRLAPGAGGRITFQVKRYHNKPTLTFPWRR